MKPFKTKESNDSVIVYYDYKLSDSFSHTKVKLFYSLGGINYFSGENNRRGIYLSVTPVTLSDNGGFTSESSVMFSGLKMLLKELKRFSKKELDGLKEYLEWGNPKLELLISQVKEQVNAGR